METSCILFRVIQLSPAVGQTYARGILCTFHKKSGTGPSRTAPVSLQKSIFATFSRKKPVTRNIECGDVTHSKTCYGKRLKPLFARQIRSKNRIRPGARQGFGNFSTFFTGFSTGQNPLSFCRNKWPVDITFFDTKRQESNFFVMRIFAEGRGVA